MINTYKQNIMYKLLCKYKYIKKYTKRQSIGCIML